MYEKFFSVFFFFLTQLSLTLEMQVLRTSYNLSSWNLKHNAKQNTKKNQPEF